MFNQSIIVNCWKFCSVSKTQTWMNIFGKFLGWYFAGGGLKKRMFGKYVFFQYGYLYLLLINLVNIKIFSIENNLSFHTK